MRAIITFQGFTESDAYRTGTENLYFQVTRMFSRGDILTTLPHPWTANVKTVAAQIARQGIRDVCVISYSHGQAAATDFIEECYKLGITVNLWLACDPVYRPGWLPRKNFFQPLSFQSLTRRIKIKAPKGVSRISYVTQGVKWPFGHEIQPFDENTRTERLVLHSPHTSIDEHPQWFELVEKELEGWANPPKATL